MVAKKEIGTAVKIVAAGPRDDVDRATDSDPSRGVKICGRDLELLHHFLREVHGGAAFHLVVDDATVHGDDRTDAATCGRASIRPKYADVEHCIELRGRSRVYGDAGLKRRELKRAAAVERQILYAFARDHAGNGVAVVGNLRGGGFDRNDFLRGPERQRHVNRCAAPGHYGSRADHRAETLHFDANFVLARHQGRSAEEALSIGRDRTV
jgi:hypothetical protein